MELAALALWKIDRSADGGIEVVYSDPAMTPTSCGLCSAATPPSLVIAWVAENGNFFDLIVDEHGRQFVKLRDLPGPQ